MRNWNSAVFLGLVLAAVLGGVLGREPEPAAAGEGTGTTPIVGSEPRGREAREHPLPLPSAMDLVPYEKLLFPFILERRYDGELGWVKDKGVRDTGPYVKGQYYGTHPAVRIFYSPKIMYWLTGNPDYWPEGKASGQAPPRAPRTGEIPDGAMMVKEMFSPPMARYRGMSEADIVATLYTPTSPGWTVMVKDKRGAPDGWFWASVWKDQHYDTPDRLGYPEAGFTMACVRCHSVAQEGGTFAALRNAEGFPGDPITFFVDDTWRDIPSELQPFNMAHSAALPELQSPRKPGPSWPNPEFIYHFNTMPQVDYEHVRLLPSEATDHVTSRVGDLQPYVTSDTCMMCHSGANSKYAFGPIMFLETKRGGLNVSPYGEWRWSPMGLAGRDPVFHSQLESELSMLNDLLGAAKGKFFGDQLVNTCGRCHFAMGKRQYDLDQKVGEAYWDARANFDREWFYLSDTNNPVSPHAKYGALGRDGISCVVCHRMVEDYEDIGEFLANSITGQFTIGPPDEIYGPFEDVITKPMEASLGMKPKFNPFIKKSRLCASCHIINLPVVDWPLANPPVTAADPEYGHDVMPQEEIDQLLASEKNPNMQGFLHRIEQATYLEWLNSRYQDEFGENASARSCQDCHMPTGYHSLDGTVRIDPIQTKIATIEDQDYPEADYRIPLADMTVRYRTEGFRRHTFQGLNLFLVELFNQFNDVLGVRKGDFETGVSGLPFAVENYVQNARENTAKVEFEGVRVDGQTIEADVRVTNLTGHRLPSGVGFRRLFLEFVVIDDTRGQERVVWASGQTNGVGVLLDGNGRVLPEEFFEEYTDERGKRRQRYHPHHRVITSPAQVQVYEELATDVTGRITTSFIRRAHHLKENRLLPQGWTREGPSDRIPSAFLKATWPGHETDGEPEWADGSGSDVVTYRVTLPDAFDCKRMKLKATLYSQAWAPYYLRDRFMNVPAGPEGDARRRLYYLASHLKTAGTPIEDWKFEVTSAGYPETKAPPAGHGHAAPPDGQVCPDCGEEHSDEGKGCG